MYTCIGRTGVQLIKVDNTPGTDSASYQGQNNRNSITINMQKKEPASGCCATHAYTCMGRVIV